MEIPGRVFPIQSPSVFQSNGRTFVGRVLTLVLAAAIAAVPSASASDVSGNWSGSVTLSIGVTLPADLQLKDDGYRVTGTAQIFEPSHSLSIQDAKHEGNTLTFRVPIPSGEMGGSVELAQFQLTLDGDILHGSLGDSKDTLQGSVLLRLVKPSVSERLSPYLFVWASTTDLQKTDFLAVVDALPQSKQYGHIVASLPVDVQRGGAHHTEHQMTPAGTLFANLFMAGRTYLFDLHQPLTPRILSSFDNFGSLSHPHSFVREPNGNILVTFQQSGEHNAAPGGLVELNPDGKLLRTSSAQDPNYHGFLRPYSLAIVPRLDRVITTCSDMEKKESTRAVQVWRLSDLKLLKTIELPPGPRGVEGQASAEPRLLADGITVLVSTFECGLYRLKGLDGDSPGADLVYDFGGTRCAVPVQIDSFWIQTVVPNSLVVIDIAEPSKPKEISRLALGQWDWPHWMSIEPQGRRFVLTGYGGLSDRVVLGSIDTQGNLVLDDRFGERDSGEPGLRLDKARPHGAVFSIP
jgi:hypothetical protein